MAEAELLRPKSRPLGVITGEVANNRKATMGIMKETSKKLTEPCPADVFQAALALYSRECVQMDFGVPLLAPCLLLFNKVRWLVSCTGGSSFLLLWGGPE